MARGLALALALGSWSAACCDVPRAQATTVAQASASARPADTLLPAPRGPLVLDPTGGRVITLKDVLGQVSSLTGVTYSSTAGVTAKLEGVRVSLSQAQTVPAGDVYPWAESLLAQQGFALAILQSDTTPLVGVYARDGMPVEVPARTIDAAMIEQCRHHPAIMFSTVVSLPHVDVRSVGNSLRILSPDVSSGGIVPVGMTNNVIVQGAGRQVAEVVAMLQKVESDAAAQAPPVPPPQK